MKLYLILKYIKLNNIYIYFLDKLYNSIYKINITLISENIFYYLLKISLN